jgi:CubicO group peptidase (beta-lactamase class C family)
MIVRRILVAGSFLLVAGPAPAQQPAAVGAADPSAAARVHAIFQRWDSTTTPGCAVGVSEAGRAVLSRAYGMADLEHGIPNSPATIFEAGSVSKQFTAAAILLLVQQGVLSLDDDVRTHIPELPDYGTPIRVRHLLNHTSGLRDWGSVAAIGGWGRSERSHTHDHVLDILSRQRALNFTPGAEYSYSNSGYNLAAILVDRLSGMSFAEFSRRHIFEPLGLVDTQWRDDHTRIVRGRSAAYGLTARGFFIDRPIEDVHGNGGLLTTVADLLTWNEALAAGRLGGAGLADLMHQPGVLNDGTQIGYAAGLNVGSHGGVPEISHTGATSGYRAFLARYPGQQLGVAVLCNVGAVSPGVAGRLVADVFLGDAVRTGDVPPRVFTPPPAPEPFHPSAAELAEYAGEYYSPDAETTLVIAVEDDTLVIRRRPATRMVLRPFTRDEFDGQFRVRFLRDEAGRVTGLGVQQPRVYDMRFERVTAGVTPGQSGSS